MTATNSILLSLVIVFKLFPTNMDYVRKYLSTQQGDQAPNSAETVSVNTCRTFPTTHTLFLFIFLSYLYKITYLFPRNFP